MQLIRFWFITHPENKFGPKNIGVTAYSKDLAKSIIKKEAAKNPYIEMIAVNLESAKVVEGIDIRLLDRDHVVPNIGPVIFEGMWYPNLNLL